MQHGSSAGRAVGDVSHFRFGERAGSQLAERAVMIMSGKIFQLFLCDGSRFCHIDTTFLHNFILL